MIVKVKTMELIRYEISHHFPRVEEIRIKVLETNAWPSDRLREFTIKRGIESNFHLDCPMSKCLGDERGIHYESQIAEMVNANETNRKVKLSCAGHGGYNLTFHCDWYVVLDISITYRPA